MPTYAYACTACGHAFDAVQKFSDAALTECPDCGGRLRKVYTSIGVSFKGSGFYRNDSRGSGKGSGSGNGSGTTKGDGAKPAEKSSSDSSSSTPSTTKESSSSSSARQGFVRLFWVVWLFGVVGVVGQQHRRRELTPGRAAWPSPGSERIVTASTGALTRIPGRRPPALGSSA